MNINNVIEKINKYQDDHYIYIVNDCNPDTGIFFHGQKNKFLIGKIACKNLYQVEKSKN